MWVMRRVSLLLRNGRRYLSQKRLTLRRPIRHTESKKAPPRTGAWSTSQQLILGSSVKKHARRTDSKTGLVYRRSPPWIPQEALTDESGAPERKPKATRPHPKAEAAAAALLEEKKSWKSFPREPLTLREVPRDLNPDTVPPLAHGLDKVLRRRGVHPMMNLRMAKGHNGSVLRGDRSLQRNKALIEIAQPEEINWLSIPPYIRASEDPNLRAVARAEKGARYSSSTSSMTGALSLLYHALSNFSDTLLNGGLTPAMAELPGSFAKFHKKPTAILVRPYPPDSTHAPSESKEPRFSVDNHQGRETASSILRDLGHSMERMVTMTGEEFREKLILKDPSDAKKPIGNEGYMDVVADVAKTIQHDEAQFYHYSRAEQFLLRAQIDARDSKTGEVFDLKSRAVASIRYSLDDYKSNSRSTIAYLTGAWHSYEREFYDMVRTVFLKYSLQLRIGRMSGAFVTYHNTSKVLGFEFLSLREMEAYIFGSKEWADIAFSHMIRTLGVILDEATESMPVEYPGYLKVVLVPLSSRRHIDIFVQRVADPKSDPFGQDILETLGPCTTSSRGKNRRKEKRAADFYDDYFEDVFERDDEDLDLAKSVTSHSSTTSVGPGMLKSLLPNDGLADLSLRSGKNPRVLPIGAQDRELAAKKLLKKIGKEYDVKDLSVWRLRLSPIVNGVQTSQPYTLKPNDSFTLNYDLKRSPSSARLLKDFFSVVDFTYNNS